MAIMEENCEQKQTVCPSAQEDNAYFKHMLDLIPVNFYFTKAPGEVLAGDEKSDEEDSSDAEDDKRPVINVKKHKRLDIDPEEKLKKKKARFDPNLPHTVTQVQEHIFSKTPQSLSNAVQKKTKKKGKSKDDDDTSSIRSSTDNIEELREKLQSRIDELKAKRKALGKNDAIEKKKIKRRQSKMELKLRKKIDKQNKKKGNESKDVATNGIKKTVINSPSKPIYNKEGKMVFSKFDFSESGKEKKKVDVPTGKNYKKLLEHVTKEKEKLKHLKETDEQKAKELEDKNAWKTALAKAEGIKVKDNPDLLKKSLKRKEKLKKISEKKWVDRTEKLESKLKEKEGKRKKNLQSRKKMVKDKKMNKMKKKGHIIPGF